MADPVCVCGAHTWAWAPPASQGLVNPSGVLLSVPRSSLSPGSLGAALCPQRRQEPCSSGTPKTCRLPEDLRVVMEGYLATAAAQRSSGVETQVLPQPLRDGGEAPRSREREGEGDGTTTRRPRERPRAPGRWLQCGSRMGEGPDPAAVS